MKRRSFIAVLLASLGHRPAPGEDPALAAPMPAPAPLPRLLQFDEVALAGFQYHEGESIWDLLAEGAAVTLEREPANSRDGNAIRVDWQGHKLGYVPRSGNRALATLVDQGVVATAVISRLRDCPNPWEKVLLRISIDAGTPALPVSTVAATTAAAGPLYPRSGKVPAIAGSPVAAGGEAAVSDDRIEERSPGLGPGGQSLPALAEPERLIARMREEEDRVTRETVDACARLGDAMVAALRPVVLGDREADDTLGDWWLRLHAVMILGLVPTDAAGRLLVEAMRDMDEAEDDTLQDWLAGDWPALFANKPASVLPAARALAEDRGHDWYIRGNAADVVVAAADRAGPAVLDAELAWVAAIAADESDDRDMRLTMGNLLLDLPRDRYRALVEDLARGEPKFGARFRQDDVDAAYMKGDDPEWRRRPDPLKFYAPEEIARRQERWAEEDARRRRPEARPESAAPRIPGTFIRATPKIGRNDPCPCGSGKKHKHCCLVRA